MEKLTPIQRTERYHARYHTGSIEHCQACSDILHFLLTWKLEEDDADSD